MGAPIYIFAGGGTGGHLYPGLAVADELRRRRPDARVVFACSNRDVDRHILEPTGWGIVVQPVRPIPRGPLDLPGFLRAYAASWRQARQMVRDLRPAAVLGLGGFAAAPVVARAAGEGVRTGLLNPDAVPGKANRLLARRVDAVFTQFSATARCFPPRLREKVRRVGCPVRAAFAEADRDEAVRHFELDPARKTLLVNGGSLGAASINEAVEALAGDLAPLGDTWQLLHVTGRDKGGAPPAMPEGLLVRRLDYCRRMDLAYAAADLALSRSGAVTVAELTATATPAVLMPYPYHADRQQTLNAADLCSAGAAVICDDAKAPAPNADALRRTLLPILGEPPRLAAMTAAAVTASGQAATCAVAAWLLGE